MPQHVRPAQPAALVCAILADAAALDQARQRLAERLGLLDVHTPVFPFDYSAYYAREMGEGLLKQVVAFRDRVDPAGLARVKRATMGLEGELGRGQGGECRRRANLDPGLLTTDSLVLATTKYAGHRICIAPDLFAEVTLLFERGAYRPLPWTYPDYRRDDVQELLQAVRGALLSERRLSGQTRAAPAAC